MDGGLMGFTFRGQFITSDLAQKIAAGTDGASTPSEQALMGTVIALAEQNADMKAELVRKTEQLDALRAGLEKVKVDRDEWKDDYAERQRHVERQAGMLDILRAELERVKASLKWWQSEAANATRQLADKESDLNKILSERLERVQAELARVREMAREALEVMSKWTTQDKGWSILRQIAGEVE